MTHHLLVVAMDPKEGREDEFNEWYDHQHLGDVLAMPEFTGAKRYRQVLPSPTGSGGYISIYEVETDDVEALHATMMAAAGGPSMPLSPAIDPTSMTLSFYAPLGS